MKKIKISTIVLLACLLLTFIFVPLIPVWLGISMGILSVSALVLLNVEIFKKKGIIKKLVLYADAVIGLFLVLNLIPIGSINYKIDYYLSHFLLLTLTMLLIAILVSAYKIEKKY